ncbi:MAG: ribonuclease HII [Chloroflexota bacterium]|nr:MAG: ribonuclease HII [Chloroflexota bacterium]
MPTLELESAASAEVGSLLIAGLDEAGRGAVAGPVVAAAVILPLDEPRRLARLSDVDDSKKLTPRKREMLFDLVVDLSLAYGIGSASAREIDDFGIIGATVLAMDRAAGMLEPPPDYLIIDGRIKLRDIPIPQQSIIRGDGKSLSIAAASILAKVSRDRVMLDNHKNYPAYGFARHKGYCTALHVDALSLHGPCPIHRHTFAPIRRTLI